MAQKRFNNWKDPIKTFELNEQRNGILHNGRYRGFDNITDAAGVGINVDVNHLTTGATKTIENGSVVSDVGIAILPNGTIVHETAAIPDLAIDDNALGIPRIDFLIAEHEYTAIVTGTPVTYSILKGPASGLPPTIVNPDKQIELGRFEIAPGAVAFANITSYTPASIPMLGEEDLQTFRTKLDILTTAEVITIAVQRDLYKIANDIGSGTHVTYVTGRDETIASGNMTVAKSINYGVSTIDVGATVNTIDVDEKRIIEITATGLPANVDFNGIGHPTLAPHTKHITLINLSAAPLRINDEAGAAAAIDRIKTPNQAQIYMPVNSTLDFIYNNNLLRWVAMGGSALAAVESNWILENLSIGDIGVNGGGIDSVAGSIRYKIVDDIVHAHFDCTFNVSLSMGSLGWYIKAPVAMLPQQLTRWRALAAIDPVVGEVEHYEMEVSDNGTDARFLLKALDNTWEVGTYEIGFDVTYQLKRS